MTSFFQSRTRAYLDHAAATPLRKEVLQAMMPFMNTHFANASALYREGRGARAAVSASRAEIAKILRVRQEEVFFVSGGTEANNLALQGIVESLHLKGRAYAECEIITTALEHPSILGVLSSLEKKGVVVHKVPVDAEGLIDFSTFEKLLTQNTVLVTIAYANSEIGVIQDVRKVARTVKQSRARFMHALPYIHLDASQAPLYLPCALDSLGIDCMTLDAAKFCGPKGIGMLIKKQGVSIAPLFFGGDQEEGLRPGTENTPSIVGCAKAFALAQDTWEKRVEKVAQVRDYGMQKILREIPGSIVNGSSLMRIANNINVSIPGIDGEYAAVVLDHYGYSVSTKSACSGLSGSGSQVIYAMAGEGEEADARALSTLRITLGEATTKRNIDGLVRVLKGHVERTRKAIDQMLKK